MATFKPQAPANQEIIPLDKRGFIPLYYQIQQALLEKIHSGQLAEGDSLDSEEELARRYQVSRMTARQALHSLKMQGVAVSQKGRGTFVKRSKLEKNIMHLQGFTVDMKQRGMKPTSRILEQTTISASEDLCEKLRITPSDKVLRLRRVRLADGTPMALELSYLPLSTFPRLDTYDFAKHSLYEIMRDQFGVRVGWADEVIEASQATAEEAKLLTIPRRSCILSIVRTVISVEEVPVELTSSRYRADRYRASVRIPTTNIE